MWLKNISIYEPEHVITLCVFTEFTTCCQISYVPPPHHSVLCLCSAVASVGKSARLTVDSPNMKDSTPEVPSLVNCVAKPTQQDRFYRDIRRVFMRKRYSLASTVVKCSVRCTSCRRIGRMSATGWQNELGLQILLSRETFPSSDLYLRLFGRLDCRRLGAGWVADKKHTTFVSYVFCRWTQYQLNSL